MTLTEQFYVSKKQKAVTIKFISPTEIKDFYADASQFEQNVLKSQDFRGASDDFSMIYDSQGKLQKIYIGMENSLKEALAKAAQRCPPGCYRIENSCLVDDLLYWGLSQYSFDAYKEHKKEPCVLLVNEADKKELKPTLEAVFLARDLINYPTNDLGPEELAQKVQDLAALHEAQFNQWVGNDLLKNNFPAIHAVGRAAEAQPRLLSIQWGDKEAPLMTLIGKGVCFDSGGLDIKPASAMRLMKKDMGGAANVLGLAHWIMSVQLPVQLHVYIPAVENAVGPDAFRPGDILKMRNGDTVEIDNTDAEGRLVLADAIVKACEEKPDLLIDFATLTGAARVAVGTEIAAMFSNDNTLAKSVSEAAEQTHDPVWQLPLFMSYKSMLKSSIADLSNGNDSPYAGATTAALFLHHFVTEGQPWLHFDIMAWNLSSKPGKPEGGEAMGIRAVAAYLKQRYLGS